MTLVAFFAIWALFLMAAISTGPARSISAKVSIKVAET